MGIFQCKKYLFYRRHPVVFLKPLRPTWPRWRAKSRQRVLHRTSGNKVFLKTKQGSSLNFRNSCLDSLAQHNGAMAANAEQIDESLKRQALAEEEAAMNQYKKSTNPFLSSPTSATPPSMPSAAGNRYIYRYSARNFSNCLLGVLQLPRKHNSNLSSTCLVVTWTVAPIQPSRPRRTGPLTTFSNWPPIRSLRRQAPQSFPRCRLRPARGPRVLPRTVSVEVGSLPRTILSLTLLVPQLTDHQMVSLFVI